MLLPEFALLREIRGGERRVLLGPEQVQQIRQAGFPIRVEKGAGEGSGFSDRDYQNAGARMVSRLEAWQGGGLVGKYKAPQVSEFQLFPKQLRLAAYLHAEGDLPLVRALQNAQATAHALEYVTNGEGKLILAASDSELAGKMSILHAAYHLQSHLGGRGVLLAPATTPQAEVLVIGYGNAGGAAIHTALSLGARVKVLGSNAERLAAFVNELPIGQRSSVEARVYSPALLESWLPQVDVVVGAILISTYDTPPMITHRHLKTMRKGAVIVDVTCGYGSGYLPTFHRCTSHQEPAYLVEGIVHIKIDALPASYPMTASRSSAPPVARHLVKLLKELSGQAKADHETKSGCVLDRGQVMHPEIQRHIDAPMYQGHVVYNDLLSADQSTRAS